MTEAPHIVRSRIDQRLKSSSRQTTAYLEHARGISAALEQFKVHYVGLNDVAVKLRCSFTHPAMPTDDAVKAVVGTEIMRVLGTTWRFS